MNIIQYISKGPEDLKFGLGYKERKIQKDHLLLTLENKHFFGHDSFSFVYEYEIIQQKIPIHFFFTNSMNPVISFV